MFSIKKIEYVNKTFRMPVELVKELEVLAQDKRISLNNLIVQCCEYALENINPGDMTRPEYNYEENDQVAAE